MTNEEKMNVEGRVHDFVYDNIGKLSWPAGNLFEQLFEQYVKEDCPNTISLNYFTVSQIRGFERFTDRIRDYLNEIVGKNLSVHL